jgi:nitric oxide reductase NorD protein
VTAIPADSLALLAGAMAGRRIGIVDSVDGPPYTDGSTMWVPPGGADRMVTPVVVQAGLLAIGSLHPRLMARLVGRRSACARYAVLEARRVLVLFGHLLPPVVEREIAALGNFAAPASAQESLERALAKEPVEAAPWTVGVLRPTVVLRARATGGTDHPQDGGLSDEQLKKLRDVTGDVAEADDDERDQLRDALTSVFSKSPLSRLLRDLMAPESASAPNESGGGAELDVGGMRRVREMGASGRICLHSAVLMPFDDNDAPTGTEHPEWDYQRERYKHGHCSVHHMDPTPPDVPQALRIQPDPELRRTVARTGLALERHRRLADGEALDLRALVDFAVAHASGEQVDPRVHESRRPTAHDLGVVVVLDASGSTGDGRAAGGRIWDEQRRVAAGLVDALEHAGDRVAAYAFRSYGRRDVRFLRVKHFDDRFDHGARRRLIDLQPAGYTRLGTAVRHGSLLARQASGTARQLLILVSDGLPYEEDYQGRYAEQDARRALEEAVSAGVGCVCLSVGSSQDAETLERIWGNFNHLHMDDTRDLATQAERLVRSALKAALAASHGLAVPHRRPASPPHDPPLTRTAT